MKDVFCVYYGFYGENPYSYDIWGVYENETDARWGKIAAQSYGYEAEIRKEQEVA